MSATSNILFIGLLLFPFRHEIVHNRTNGPSDHRPNDITGLHELVCE